MDSRDDKISESELSRLYKIRKTLLKMISDRGYLVSSIEKELTYDKWKETFDNRKKSTGYYKTASFFIFS